jgi:hypothetical protein
MLHSSRFLSELFSFPRQSSSRHWSILSVTAPRGVRQSWPSSTLSHPVSLVTGFILAGLDVKVSRYTPWRRLGGEEYSSYSFTTSALDGGEWSASRPGRDLPPGKGPPLPIVQEAGWAPEPVWTQRLEEKSFAPAGDRTPIAQSSSP